MALIAFDCVAVDRVGVVLKRGAASSLALLVRGHGVAWLRNCESLTDFTSGDGACGIGYLPTIFRFAKFCSGGDLDEQNAS